MEAAGAINLLLPRGVVDTKVTTRIRRATFLVAGRLQVGARNLLAEPLAKAPGSARRLRTCPKTCLWIPSVWRSW